MLAAVTGTNVAHSFWNRVVRGETQFSGAGELTLTVVAEAHLGLAKTDGVFAGADTIELFKFSLVDILERITLG